MRSADGAWLAIGSSGVAHGYGWLYELSTDEPHLVAFQFGGSVQSHSFSPDDRFALFTVATPAETQLLKVVDRGDVAGHASDTGFAVEVDEEGEPPFAYEFDEWREPHTLCFTFDGTPYCVNAETQHVERQAEPDEPADDDVDEREVPVGGVETGQGGAADRPEPLLLLTAALLLSAGALALVRRRRRV